MLQAQNESSAQSLNFRKQLASLVSPLRRVRARVPFYRLAAHRIPTLWGLYRALLWTAPTENIQNRVRVCFRKNRHLTGPNKTIRELQKGYKWLETFKLAQSGDVKTQTLLLRYDRFLEMKEEKEHWKQLVRKEVEWRERLKNRPILTGGILLPTSYSPAFPRMKPQPMAISRIITNRLKQKERRHMKMEELNEMKDLIRREQQLELKLKEYEGPAFESIFEGEPSWTNTINESISLVHEKTMVSIERNLRPIPQSLLEQVRDARRHKIENKTKERERERRGEILPITRKRWRKGLTAHLLSTMPEKQKKEELIVQRSIAEVGYVGLLKKRKGWKLKEPKIKVEGKKWSVEDAEWIGKEERAGAAQALRALQEINAKKRAEYETISPL